MKNLLIGGLLAAAVMFGINASVEQQKTESYAIVNVLEKAERVIIRVTKDGNTEVLNIKSGYVEKEDMPNIEPVIQKLQELNAEGYELVNSSIASIVYGRRAKVTRPFHSFILVKRS